MTIADKMNLLSLMRIATSVANATFLKLENGGIMTKLYEKSEKIMLCDQCLGDGKEIIESGNGGFLRNGEDCKRCNGSGGLLETHIHEIKAFSK